MNDNIISDMTNREEPVIRIIDDADLPKNKHVDIHLQNIKLIIHAYIHDKIKKPWKSKSFLDLKKVITRNNIIKERNKSFILNGWMYENEAI